MAGRIDPVQAMRQHADGRQLVMQSAPVGADVDAVSQSADNQQIRDRLGQIPYQGFGQRASVFGRIACAYDTDDASCVEVCISLEIEKYGSVRAFPETYRIIRVGQEIA